MESITRIEVWQAGWAVSMSLIEMLGQLSGDGVVLGLYRDWWDHDRGAVWLRVGRTISKDQKRGNP